MSETSAVHGERPTTGRREPFDVRRAVRQGGVIHVLGGLLGFVGPAVWGNDDGLVNWEPGLFLGRVAVNGPHALMHVLIGVLGLAASGDAEWSRRYAAGNAAYFGALAAVGWRSFGFERGVHRLGPLAADGWGNLGHTIVSALGLLALLRADAER